MSKPLHSNVQTFITSKATWLGWLICGLGAAFYCYEYLLRITPSVMSEELRQAFHLDATAFGNLAAFYYYAYTPMQLPVGVLMDRYGPRRLLIFASLVCAFGTYLFSLHEYLFVAQLGRFLVGFGSAFAFVGVLKLATLHLPPNRFGMIAGLTTTLGMVGAMAGDIVLVGLVKVYGWSLTILLSAIAGIILAGIIALIMPKTARQNLQHTTAVSTDFKILIQGLLKLMRNPYLWLNGLVGALMYLSLSVFGELWGPPYLQGTRGFTPTEAAHAISMVFLGWAVGGPIAGWFSDFIRNRRLPLIIGAIFTGIVISIIFYVPGLSKTALFILLFLFGIASSAQSIVFAVAKESSPLHLSGIAIAFTNMLVMLGGALLQPIVGWLLDLRWGGEVINQLRVYSPDSYHFALFAIPAGALLAVVILCFMKETAPEKSEQ